jgi:hypothetical protein
VKELPNSDAMLRACKGTGTAKHVILNVVKELLVNDTMLTL